ncbi:MAG: methyltransferase family protein [bacterium]
MGKNKKRKIFEILAFPPFHFFFAVILSLISLFIKSFGQVDIFPFNLLGIILITGGMYIFIYYSWVFKKFNTTLKFEYANQLYTQGFFRYSRNPMYLGGLISLLGFSVLAGSLFSFIGAMWFFVTMNFIAIPLEESMLEEKFPGHYSAYKSRVRRWF